MVVVVFVNSKDKEVSFLGKALYSLLDRQYFVFTREESEYPHCPIDKTMSKLREIAQHTTDNRLMVCFGCRVFPNNIKQIEKIATSSDQNVVLLKRLKGSKTWTVKDDHTLSFDNERIADCGIFILNREELVKSSQDNFNSYIRMLITQQQLFPSFVDFWLFANSQAPTQKRGRR